MATSTTSRLLSLGKNNKALQTLIHRHLLRPTAASATQLLKPTTEKSSNLAEMLKKKMKMEEKSPVSENIVGFSPFGMMGFSGFDRSGILQARADSDGSLGFDAETDTEDSDGDFGSDFDDDYENVDMSEDSEEDTEDDSRV